MILTKVLRLEAVQMSGFDAVLPLLSDQCVPIQGVDEMRRSSALDVVAMVSARNKWEMASTESAGNEVRLQFALKAGFLRWTI